MHGADIRSDIDIRIDEILKSDPDFTKKFTILDPNPPKKIPKGGTKKKPRDSCSHFALWNYEGKYYRDVPCKKWICPACAKEKWKNIKRRMNNSEANGWKFKTHVILTLKNQEDNKIILESFNDFITFIKRGGTFEYFTVKRGNKRRLYIPPYNNLWQGPEKEIKYIWVLEVQHKRYKETGDIVLHLHILFNKRLPKKQNDQGKWVPWKEWIFPIWNHALKLHGSKEIYNTIRVSYPGNWGPGNYFSKYFTKEDMQILLEKGYEVSYKGKPIYDVEAGLVPGDDGIFGYPIRKKKYKRWHGSKYLDPKEPYETDLDGNIIYKIGTWKKINNWIHVVPKDSKIIADSHWIFMLIEFARLLYDYMEKDPSWNPSLEFIDENYGFKRKIRNSESYN